MLETVMIDSVNEPAAHSETCQTSKMELFPKIVNNFQLVNYFRKKIHLRGLVGFKLRLCHNRA